MVASGRYHRSVRSVDLARLRLFSVSFSVAFGGLFIRAVFLFFDLTSAATFSRPISRPRRRALARAAAKPRRRSLAESPPSLAPPRLLSTAPLQRRRAPASSRPRSPAARLRAPASPHHRSLPSLVASCAGLLVITSCALALSSP